MLVRKSTSKLLVFFLLFCHSDYLKRRIPIQERWCHRALQNSFLLRGWHVYFLENAGEWEGWREVNPWSLIKASFIMSRHLVSWTASNQKERKPSSIYPDALGPPYTPTHPTPSTQTHTHPPTFHSSSTVRARHGAKILALIFRKEQGKNRGTFEVLPAKAPPYSLHLSNPKVISDKVQHLLKDFVHSGIYLSLYIYI